MDDQQVAPETTAQEQPVVVQAKPLETAKLDENSVASSGQPYHTAVTEKIQEDRAKDVPDEPKKEDFEFKANGYTVKARKAEDTEKGFADEDGLVYSVSGNDLLDRVYGNKQDAKIFVTTHAPSFAERGNIAL